MNVDGQGCVRTWGARVFWWEVFLLWITVNECLLSFYYVAGPVLSPGGYCSDVDTDSVLMEFTAQ